MTPTIQCRSRVYRTRNLSQVQYPSSREPITMPVPIFKSSEDNDCYLMTAVRVALSVKSVRNALLSSTYVNCQLGSACVLHSLCGIVNSEITEDVQVDMHFAESRTRYLTWPIGTEQCAKEFLILTIQEWKKCVNKKWWRVREGRSI